MAIPVAAIAGGIGLAKSLFGGGGNKRAEMMAKVEAAKNRKMWADELEVERQRRAGREADYTQASDEELGAIDRLERMRPTETERFRPDRIDSVDTDAVRNLDATETRGVGFDELEGATGENLRDLDVDGELSAFAKRSEGFDYDPGYYDAGAAVNSYARGAASDFFRDTGVALDDLRARSVAAGRVDTGLFDKDQGDVVTELGRGFTSDIARQAVAAAGITSTSKTAADRMRLDAKLSGRELGLDALKSGATLRFDRAKGLDDNALARGESLGKLRLDRAGTIDETRRRAVTDAAGLDLDKAKASDQLTLDRGQFIDTYGQDAARTALGARVGRADRASGREEASNNRYLDILEGNTNLAINNQNAAEQRRVNRNKGFTDLLSTGFDAYRTFSGGK